MKLYTSKMLDISIEDMQGQPFIKEVWSGVLTEKIFKRLIYDSIEVYEKYLPNILNRHETLLMYANVSGITMIRTEEVEWLEKEINPIYERLGFTHQAVVMPSSFFASQAVLNYEGVSESGKFVTNVFKDELSAIRWYFKKINKALQ